MKQFDQQWQKLAALARRADASQDCAAPYGFAVRVTARAENAPKLSSWALPERMAFRGLLIAMAFGLGAMVFNISSFALEPTDEYTQTDAVGEILDLT